MIKLLFSICNLYFIFIIKYRVYIVLYVTLYRFLKFIIEFELLLKKINFWTDKSF